MKLKDLFESIGKAVGTILEALIDNAPEIFAAYKHILIRNAHFYISDKMFFDELNSKGFEHSNEEKLLNFIDEFYSKSTFQEIVRLFEEWKSFRFIEKRMSILNSCLDVIKSDLKDEDKSNVVIPVIIAQIDGVVKDLVLKIEPEVGEKGYQNYKRKLIESEAFNKGQSFSDYINILHPLRYIFYFDKKVCKLGKNGEALFEKATDKELEKYYLRRDGIMHGEVLNYGKKIEMIRVLLMFDMILKTSYNVLEKLKKRKEEEKEGVDKRLAEENLK